VRGKGSPFRRKVGGGAPAKGKTFWRKVPQQIEKEKPQGTEQPQEKAKFSSVNETISTILGSVPNTKDLMRRERDISDLLGLTYPGAGSKKLE